MNDENLELRGKLTLEALELLEFSTIRNNGVDRESWLRFVIRTHQDKAQLDPNLLWRWLNKVRGWPDNKAEGLAVDFETQTRLLRMYDGSRLS